jgi:large subunit ribosomal protein L32
MAVPKKRTGHSAQGSRRSNWKATKQETTKCPNCGATVLAHTVCTACGTYKGQPVSLKDRKEEVKETKKTTKKSTKKASEEVKETKAIEVKAEEVKEETKAEEAVVEAEVVEEKEEK